MPLCGIQARHGKPRHLTASGISPAAWNNDFGVILLCLLAIVAHLKEERGLHLFSVEGSEVVRHQGSMMATVLRRQISAIQIVQAQHTPTVIVQIGGSLARLAARQACQLASALVVQAENAAPTKTEWVDSLLVDGWIAKPSSFRGGTHRKVLVACRASKVMLREATLI